MPEKIASDVALSFSPEAVHLQRRIGDEWQETDHVRFDVQDLRSGLGRIRTALTEEMGAPSVLLVIPDDQLLYTRLQVEADGPAEMPAAVAKALEGLTPYEITDLAHDWLPAGPGEVHVAAVARQTLIEAADFAIRHRFSIRGFIADPDPERFPGEPAFSLSAASEEGDEGAFATVINPARIAASIERLRALEAAQAATRADAPVVAAGKNGSSGGMTDALPATAEAGHKGEMPAAESPASAVVSDAPQVVEEDGAGASVQAAGVGGGDLPASDAVAEALTNGDGGAVLGNDQPGSQDGKLGLTGLPDGAQAKEVAEIPVQGVKTSYETTGNPAFITRIIASVPYPEPAGQADTVQASVDRSIQIGPRVKPVAQPQPRIARPGNKAHPRKNGGHKVPLPGSDAEGAADLQRSAAAIVRHDGQPGISDFGAGRMAANLRRRLSGPQGPLLALLGLLLVAMISIAILAGDRQGQGDVPVLVGDGAGVGESAPGLPSDARSEDGAAAQITDADPVSPADIVQAAADDALGAALREAMGTDAPKAAQVEAPAAKARPSETGPADTARSKPLAESADATRSDMQLAQAATGSDTPPAVAELPSMADANPVSEPVSAPPLVQATVTGANEGSGSIPVPSARPDQDAPDSVSAPILQPEATTGQGATPVAPPTPPVLVIDPAAQAPPAIATANTLPPAPVATDRVESATPTPKAAPRPVARPAGLQRAAVAESAAPPAASPAAADVASTPPPTRAPTAPAKAQESPAASATISAESAPVSRPARRPKPSAGQSPAAAQNAPAASAAPETSPPAAAPVRPGAAVVPIATPAVDRGLYRSIRPPARPGRSGAWLDPGAAGQFPTNFWTPPGSDPAAFAIPTRMAVLALPDRVAARRYAQARPMRKPGVAATAIDAALQKASTMPAAKPAASTASTTTAGGARPARKPASGGANSAAIESAIASAVQSSTVPTGPGPTVVPGALRASPPPPRRAGAAMRATSSGIVTAAAPAAGQPSTAQTAAAAQATQDAAAEERRRIEEELQAQAEARIRARADADSQVEARARAEAEARARAQAEAEERAARARGARYRPAEIDDEPELSSTAGGTDSAEVARNATIPGGLNTNRTTLIGVVDAGKASRGLIRLRNGRIVTVRVGDRIDGGPITAIGDGMVTYTVGGRARQLKILDGR